MFTAALFIIAKNWEQLKCPSPGEWITSCGMYTMRYFSATRRNEL